MPNYEMDTQSNLRPVINTNKLPEKNKDSIGACWIRENLNGVEYLSMKITIDGVVHNIKGFMNGEKMDGDHKPEYLLFKSKNIRKETNGNK